MKITKKHTRFFIINVIIVTFFIFILFGLNNGEGNDFPYDLVAISFLISTLIIYFQYPLLNLRNNWFYKSFIFYSCMVLFLFTFGIIIAWNEKVGSNAAGTWLARVDSGMRMSIYGQIFGGIFGFLPILGINFILRKKLFKKKGDYSNQI